MMYYVRCRNGARYKVHEAISLKAAIDAIARCLVSGSVGSKNVSTTYAPGKPLSEWPSTVVAHVSRVNSDNTEQRPYTEVY